MNLFTSIKSVLILSLVGLCFVACHTVEPVVITTQSNSDSLQRDDSIAAARHGQIKESLSVFLNSTYKSNDRVKSFYLQSNNEPVWRSTEKISEARIFLQNSVFHGLNPQDYGVAVIDSLSEVVCNDTVFCAQSVALLDIKLTESVLKYTDHLLKGKLNPKNLYTTWNFTNRSMPNADSVIYSSINNNRVLELDSLFEPKNTWYANLKNGLQRFCQLQQNNKESLQISYPGTVLHVGDSNEHVILLKQKLASLNLYSSDSITPVFDAELKQVVKAFQRMHGLNPDGVPGVNTYLFLNWSVRTYIEILQVNLERLRWLPDVFPETYLMVNIPEYKLRLYRNNKEMFSSKVIVGKTKNKTPIFKSNIEYVVYNPCWTIPNSIASKKILPKLKTDSTYLESHNMFICQNGKELASSTIDYGLYSQNNFPYKIFQRAGANNALGKVKFMFPNNYQVFLHDTPSKYLFNKDFRAFSSGCIRVDNAMQLASKIHFEIEHNTMPLSYYLGKGYPEIVNLKTQIPIYILYYTCIGKFETGELRFYRDVYMHDADILKYLHK